MSKSRVMALLLTLVVCGSSQAAKKYGMAGCGLGTYVIKSSGGIMQATAASTNFTVFSKIIGIVAGASNCVPDEGEKAALFQEQFVSKNFISLSKEIAQGDGETLAAFSDSLGCKHEVFSTVASRLKDAYPQIFSSPGALSALETAKEQLRKDPALVKSCSALI